MLFSGNKSSQLQLHKLRN